MPHQYWHTTLNNLGVETNSSHFSGLNLGVWTTLTSVDPKLRTRCYSATAYHLPNSSRKNLVVLTEAVVNKVVLEKDTMQNEWIAKGTVFTSSGEGYSKSLT